MRQSRDLASVMWHRHGQSIDCVYVVGEPERFFGGEEVASLLAEHAGLVRVRSPDDHICWTTTKDPSVAS